MLAQGVNSTRITVGSLGRMHSWKHSFGIKVTSKTRVGLQTQKSHSISKEVKTVHDEPLCLENSDGIWSIVIPTYNRLQILVKCLDALENQQSYSEAGVMDYEIVVVDDGSTDGTVDYLMAHLNRFPHMKVYVQSHGGAAAARNYGVLKSLGETIVFIDSDMVVVPEFLKEHCLALKEAFRNDSDDRAFSYGRVINTANFENPQDEKFRISDISAAFFATGNVAISRKRLLGASNMLPEGSLGPFDSSFSEYGWEDLELGERLRQQGSKIVHCPGAIGYHYHPPFTMDQMNSLIDQERQRGRNGVRFLEKHPNFNVRLMVQLTPFHELFWGLLTLGGLINEKVLSPIVEYLVSVGQWRFALALLIPVLNWYTIQAAKEELQRKS